MQDPQIWSRKNTSDSRPLNCCFRFWALQTLSKRYLPEGMWQFYVSKLVRQVQSSQTLMSHILIFPLKIVQITLFMIETIIFWLGGDDLALKLEIFVLVHTQRGSWRLIIINMRNIFLFLCINQPLWVCTRTNISNFNTKSSPPNQNIMVSIIKSVIWTFVIILKLK